MSFVVLASLPLFASVVRAQGESWVAPIALGGATGAVGGAATGWLTCGGVDTDPERCAAVGALALTGSGMLIGAVLRATRTSGWRATWVGGLTGVATGLLVGGVAAVAGSGDQPGDYLLIGGAAFGTVGLISGTVVGQTRSYSTTSLSLLPSGAGLRIGLRHHF